VEEGRPKKKQARRKRGLRKLYPDGRSRAAELHGTYMKQLEQHYGPLDPLGADYASLVAFLRVSLAESMKRYSKASSDREHGRGRRPAVHDVNRLLKRVGLDFGSFDQALRRLEALATKNGAHPMDDLAERLLAMPTAAGQRDDQ
jgi:hypothetical protein